MLHLQDKGNFLSASSLRIREFAFLIIDGLDAYQKDGYLMTDCFVPSTVDNQILVWLTQDTTTDSDQKVSPLKRETSSLIPSTLTRTTSLRDIYPSTNPTLPTSDSQPGLLLTIEIDRLTDDNGVLYTHWKIVDTHRLNTLPRLVQQTPTGQWFVITKESDLIVF